MWPLLPPTVCPSQVYAVLVSLAVSVSVVVVVSVSVVAVSVSVVAVSVSVVDVFFLSCCRTMVSLDKLVVVVDVFVCVRYYHLLSAPLGYMLFLFLFL